MAKGNGAAYIEFDRGAPPRFFRVCEEIDETKAEDGRRGPGDLGRRIAIVSFFDFVSSFYLLYILHLRVHEAVFAPRTETGL